MGDEKFTFVEHLEELRGRLFKSIICIIVAAGLCYNFVDKIMENVAKPVGKLVFIAPHEAFIANIKIALFGGVFLASPFLLFHIWRFISTGLNKNEIRQVFIFAPLSFIFFLCGIAFGYIIIVPIGVKFLLGFATEVVSPMISISKYISFVGTLTLAFGAIFQLPIASLFLTKIGLVTPGFLAKKRRHAVVLIFIGAAMLTPPDIVTQCLMAVPLLILYEIGIIFSKIVYKPL